MSQIYVHSTREERHPISAFSLGTLVVLSIFALLPILTNIPNPFVKTKSPTVTTYDILPPAIIEEPPAKIDDAKKPDLPEIEKIIPEVDLTTIEKLLNPGDGGARISVGLGNVLESIDTRAEIFLPEALDKRPRVLVAAKPLYPYSLKGVPGEVVVQFVIDAAGKVKRAKVIKSSNWGFEKAALEAVNKSKWQPGEKEGKPVQTLVSLTIHFKD